MDARYGPTPPWHDAALELRGPVVADVLAVFAERWNDPHPLDKRTPYRMLIQRLARMPRHPRPAARGRSPAASPPGTHAVQLLRTYGVKHPPFPFAPEGERSIARAYEKAFALAGSCIYLEDQYLWSAEVAAGIVAALRRNPELHVIAVVPRYPDSDGPLAGPPSRIGQLRAIGMLRRAAPDRVGVFDLENAAGTPVYIHAKVCVVDDRWATCGSDNFNRRSWTSDSELTCAVVDGIGAGGGAGRTGWLRDRAAAPALGGAPRDGGGRPGPGRSRAGARPVPRRGGGARRLAPIRHAGSATAGAAAAAHPRAGHPAAADLGRAAGAHRGRPRRAPGPVARDPAVLSAALVIPSASPGPRRRSDAGW